MKNRKKLENLIVIFVLFVATYLFLLQSPLCPFFPGESSIDSSVFRTIGWQMSKGLIPYRDTFDHKGPLIYLINYIGTLVSFDYGVWFFEFVFIFVSLVFIYKICRLLNDKVISVFSTLISFNYLFMYFEKGNLVEEYALTFISISLYFFLDYLLNNNINKFRLIICGSCMGCVLMLRSNMIGLWIAFCLGIFIDCLIRKNYKDLKFFSLWFLLGLIISILPFIVWMLLNSALEDFIFCNFTFNFMYSSDENTSNIISILRSFKYFGLTPLMIICIFVLLINIRKNIRLNSVYLFCILLNCLLISVSGRMYAHYGMNIVPLYSYPVALLLNGFGKIKKTFIIQLGLTVFLFLGICFTNWKEVIIGAIKRNTNDYYNVENSYIYQDMIDIIESNTEENDKIFVYGNSNYIYLASKRLPASKYSYQFPIGNIDNSIFENCIKDLNISKPKYIVITEAISESIDNYLENNNYALCWSSNAGDVMLYVR